MSETEKSEHSSHKQILRSSAIIGGASIVNILVGLLRIKAVAVLLGPAGVGLVGILSNLMEAAATVSALGFGNVGTRQIAEANGRQDQASTDVARRALFWGTMILAVLGAIIFWLLRKLIAVHILGDLELAPYVGWVAVGVALTVASGSQRALLTGMRRVGDIARVTIFSSFISAGLGIGIVYVLGEAGIVFLVVSAPLAGFIVTHVYVSKLPKIVTKHTPINKLAVQWVTLVRLGAAFMFAGLSVLLGQLAVRSMVQQKLGIDNLGYFQASWVISMTYIGFVLSAMGTDYYPRLTAIIHDRERAIRLVNEQAHVAILLAGPVLVSMMALSPWVISILYTSDFAPAADLLRWQIMGDVLKILSWPMGFIILACGKGMLFMVKEAFVVLVFVVTTWLILPILGLESTGIAFVAMYLANLPLLVFISRALIGFTWSSEVKLSALLLVFLTIIVVLLARYNELLSALIGSAAALVLAIFAFVKLANKANVSGPIGKMVGVINRKLAKFN